jgi:hypothetical protein
MSVCSLNSLHFVEEKGGKFVFISFLSLFLNEKKRPRKNKIDKSEKKKKEM